MSQPLTKNRAHSGDTYSPESVARIERNIEGAFDFLRSVVADPTIIDRIPPGARIVLSPDDAPDVAAANRRAGIAAQQAGQSVYVHRIRRARVKSTEPARGRQRIVSSHAEGRLAGLLRWGRHQAITVGAGRRGRTQA